jgi:LacI family transcriptional regulator
MHVHRTVVLGSELVPRESTLGRAGAAAAARGAATVTPSDPRRTEA